MKEHKTLDPWISCALWVCLLFAAEVGITLPSQTYLSNPLEFAHAYREVLGSLLCISFLLFAVPASVFLWGFKNRDARRWGTALLLGLTIALWVQSNYHPWTQGPLTGHKIDWEQGDSRLWDAGLWGLIFAIVLVMSSTLPRWIPKAAPVFLIFQIVLIGMTYARLPNDVETCKLEVGGGTDLFSFSKNRNVILLLLDGFQGNIFSKDVLGKARWEKLFDGFTFFPNATSAFMSTVFSVPNIISGTLYDNTRSYSHYLQSISNSLHNLFRVLERAGVRVSASTDVTWTFSGQFLSMSEHRRRWWDLRWAWGDMPALFDTTIFRSVPYFLKPFVYRDGRWFLVYAVQRFSWESSRNPFPIPACSKATDIHFLNELALQGRADQQGTTFKFIHLRTPHPPYDLDENLHARKNPGETQADYEINTQAALRIAEAFMEQLKKKGLYDNSLILIVSDHGLGYPANPTEKVNRGGEVWTPAILAAFDFIKGRFSPLILVKDFGAQGPMKISQAPVTLGDVPQTIVDSLGVPADFSGESHQYRSLLKAQEGAPRVRYSRYYQFPTPDGYMTPTAEFRVEGNSQNDDSWHFTHRAFIRGRGPVQIACGDFNRDNFEITLEGRNTECYKNP